VSTEPLTTNAADVDQVNEAARVEKDDEKLAIADVRAELATYEARRRSWARVGPVFDDIRGDSLVDVGRALGRREVALAQLRAMSLHLELFVQMWREGLERERDENKAREANRRRSPPRSRRDMS